MIVFYGDVKTTENDVYYNARFDRLRADVDSTFGIIDGKVKNIIQYINDPEYDNPQRNYYLSFIGSLLLNLLFSAGLFEYDKKKFLEQMEGFYDTYKNSEYSTVDSK